MIRLLIIYCFFVLAEVSVSLAAEPLSARDNEIRAAIEIYLQNKSAGLDFEPKIKRISIHGGVLPIDGELDYEISAPQQWEGWGNLNLAVVVRRGDRIIRNIPVKVEIEALAEMVVTNRQIDNETIITEANITIRKQDVASVRGQYIKQIQDAIGKKTRQTLRANIPIKPNQLIKVPLIHSGQIVTIIAEKSNMRVTIIGKAKKSGAIGDTISVQNMNSLKEFPAQIIDSNTVQVLF